MQKTLSSSQLKEMFSGADGKDDDEVVNPNDVQLEEVPEKKDEKELNAALIEKYFAESEGDKTDPNAFVDDEDEDERDEDSDSEDKENGQTKIAAELDDPYTSDMG